MYSLLCNIGILDVVQLPFMSTYNFYLCVYYMYVPFLSVLHLCNSFFC